MTTFILHGGYTSTPNENNKKYYSEIAKRTLKNRTILFVYFAQDKEKWNSLLQNDKENFEKSGVIINFDCEIASSNLEKLTQQIKSSDCIYLRGGHDYILKEKLTNLENFEKLIKGKIVVGSSAGANVLSTYFYRNSKEQIEEGLGILQIKVFCHYNQSKKEKLKQLKEHKENLPIYTIPEADFIITKNLLN